MGLINGDRVRDREGQTGFIISIFRDILGIGATGRVRACVRWDNDGSRVDRPAPVWDECIDAADLSRDH